MNDTVDWCELPDTLLLRIFECLDPEDSTSLRHTAAVCQAWRTAVHELVLGDTAASRPKKPMPPSTSEVERQKRKAASTSCAELVGADNSIEVAGPELVSKPHAAGASNQSGPAAPQRAPHPAGPPTAPNREKLATAAAHHTRHPRPHLQPGSSSAAAAAGNKRPQQHSTQHGSIQHQHQHPGTAKRARPSPVAHTGRSSRRAPTEQAPVGPAPKGVHHNAVASPMDSKARPPAALPARHRIGGAGEEVTSPARLEGTGIGGLSVMFRGRRPTAAPRRGHGDAAGPVGSGAAGTGGAQGRPGIGGGAQVEGDERDDSQGQPVSSTAGQLHVSETPVNRYFVQRGHRHRHRQQQQQEQEQGWAQWLRWPWQRQASAAADNGASGAAAASSREQPGGGGLPTGSRQQTRSGPALAVATAMAADSSNSEEAVGPAAQASAGTVVGQAGSVGQAVAQAEGSSEQQSQRGSRWGERLRSIQQFMFRGSS